MAKKMVMTGPGRVVNRAAKHGKLDLAIDPSPGGFLSDARRETERIKALIIPGDGNTDPIEIYVHPKSLVLRCESAMIPPGRLADLEALITEESDVHIVLEYVPKQDQLPFEVKTGAATAEAAGAAAAEGAGSGPRAPDIPDRIEIKFRGLRNCECAIDLVVKDGQWYAPYTVQVGHLEQGRGVADLQGYSSRAAALAGTKAAITLWLEDAQPSGTADAKRSMQRRMGDACRQIEEQLDPLLTAAAAGAANPEPEEDEEPELNADEDDSDEQ